MDSTDLFGLEGEGQDEVLVVDEEESRFKATQRTKRRRRSSDEDDEISKPAAAIVKPISAKKLAGIKKATDRSGVVYMSTVPKHMTSQLMREMLGRLGEVGRIYLAPKDDAAFRKNNIVRDEDSEDGEKAKKGSSDDEGSSRNKKGRNKSRRLSVAYVEGWIEFADKRVARSVVATLNAQTIGGRKRSLFHDCLWNLKYLPRFKWHHLTDQMSYETRSRQARLDAELAQSSRENKTYLANVEKSKHYAQLDRIRTHDEESQYHKPRRNFKQKQAWAQKTLPTTTSSSSSTAQPSEALSYVMSKVF